METPWAAAILVSDSPRTMVCLPSLAPFAAGAVVGCFERLGRDYRFLG